VRAALVQTKWTGDKESMTELHERYAREAAPQGAQIIGFQEVLNAPYFCQVQEPEHYRWAEPVPDSPTIVRMQAPAKELSVTPPPAEAGGFSLCRVGVATDQPGP
jgi:N-carbamoylputrescine amidase